MKRHKNHISEGIYRSKLNDIAQVFRCCRVAARSDNAPSSTQERMAALPTGRSTDDGSGQTLSSALVESNGYGGTNVACPAL